MKVLLTSHGDICVKLKNFLRKHLITIIVSIVIVLIGLSVNWVRTYSEEAIIDATFDEMEQVGQEYQSMLSNKIEETSKELITFSKFMIESNVDRSNVVEYIKSQSHATQFSNLYYIDLDGYGISVQNEYRDFSQNIAFINALDNNIYVDKPDISNDTSKIVFELTVPVTKNNEVVAVLFCEIVVDEFFTILSENEEYAGDTFFVDSNLNMSYSTSNNHLGYSYIPSKDIEEMGVTNVAQAQIDIKEKQNGGFYYDYYGEPKVMVYYPIEGVDLALAMNINVDSINSQLVTASNNFDMVGTAIYWIVIVLVVYITISHHRSSKRMLKAAYYDSLTGLPNMTKLKSDMSDILKNSDKEYSILIFDAENFKAINEIFGYEVGDRALKTVKTFSDTIKNPSLITARVSDDKFAMFAESHVLDDINNIMFDYRTIFRSALPELGDYAATYKIGRYVIDENETDIEEIISKVNLAHTKAKATKGIPLCEYDEAFKKILRIEAEITKKMRSALDNNEFIAYLQPKFSINNDRLIGAEALIRWIESDGNIIFPNDFIPLFERNGFIVEIDKYILEQACKTIKEWIDNGLEVVPISVNCSRLNLNNPYFISGIVAIADKYSVPHEYIEIELTESTTIESPDTIEKLFDDLHSEGFKISIDDFGAGYSSLGMLKNLHIDTLKMDKSFFVGSKNARRDDMLIDSIVKMAHNLKMNVVAEGIETEDQVNLLKSMNCDAVQGYFYDKPIPISEFLEKYSFMMTKKVGINSDEMLLVDRINDIKYASSFVPSGIIVAKLDEYFTLIEANDYYFDIIKYSRKEVRDLFSNRLINLMDAESRKEFSNYISEKIKSNPTSYVEFTIQFPLKTGELHICKLSGKINPDENGETRIYASITDITQYTDADNNFQNEKNFITRISTLTKSDFFDYEIETNTIRFSKNFADRHNIPDTIHDFTKSKLGREMFPKCIEIFNNYENTQTRSDGEFYIKLPSGEAIWYLYTYTKTYDEQTKSTRFVGKLSEAFGHKLERDILEIKSNIDTEISIYDKKANERYIHNYLRIASSNAENGVIFVVNLENFDKLDAVFGKEFTKLCLNDIGNILRGIFRNSDIIGRTENKEFYVFVSNIVSLDFIENKTNDLRTNLTKEYEKDETRIQINATVGTALFPENGSDFATLYQKAKSELDKS